MRRKFMIADIEVGNPLDPLIIPEIGINHNGDLNAAIEMVDAAQAVGARIIKHQTHIVDDEMSKQAHFLIPGNASKSIYEIMEECALSEEEELELKRYVESKNMFFLSTPFSRAAVNRLEKFGVDAYKIGSGEMNNYPLLEYVASFGKPMIVSTGMNSIDTIEKAVEILERRNIKYALLHTTNLYPTPPGLVRLGGMQELMKLFSNIPIGLSDHTLNNNSSIAALTLGATVIERHFTDTKQRKGPDISCSMDKNELKQLLIASKEIPLMLEGKKEAAKEEQITINFAFSTIVSIRDIKAGEKFSSNNIWAKRPGIGDFAAAEFDQLLGKTAASDINEGTHIMSEMVYDDEE